MKLKTLILVTVIFLMPVFGTSQKNNKQLFESKLSHSANVQVTWEMCLTYIQLYATNYDSSTISRLAEEVSNGNSTWTVTNTSSISGGDLGWPGEGQVIEFATLGDANVAATLILIATQFLS